MDKTIITIAREHGSGGREIGKCLAEMLGIPYYNKEIIAVTAEQSGLAEEFVRQVDTKGNSYSVFDLYTNTSTPSIYTQARIAQEKAIRYIANQGSCIIIGRAAGYVLRDMPERTNVFIHAPIESRVERIVSTYGDDPKSAEKEIRRSDKQRSNFYSLMTGQKWNDYKLYDLVINSNLGIEGSAKVIAEYVRNKK